MCVCACVRACVRASVPPGSDNLSPSFLFHLHLLLCRDLLSVNRARMSQQWTVMNSLMRCVQACAVCSVCVCIHCMCVVYDIVFIHIYIFIYIFIYIVPPRLPGIIYLFILFTLD